MIQCGGHFEGSAVLHWEEGAGGKGVLLVGDTTAVVLDRRYVSFMRSYPNNIPLSAPAVRGIVEAMKPYPFDKIYGGWWGRDVAEGGERGATEIGGAAHQVYPGIALAEGQVGVSASNRTKKNPEALRSVTVSVDKPEAPGLGACRHSASRTLGAYVLWCRLRYRHLTGPSSI